MTPVEKYYDSYNQLKAGDYKTGFRLFESRWHPETLNSFPENNKFKKLVPQRVWKGEPLFGKSITVQMEMGYGDCIMFARFLPLLKIWGAEKVVVLQTKSLHNLMAQFQCIDAISNNDEKGIALETDYWIGSMSLPYFALHARPEIRYLFPITKDYVVGKEGYMSAKPLPLDGKCKIGVNWKCSKTWGHDLRSFSDEQISVLKDAFPNVTFYSLNPESVGPFKSLPTDDWKEDWSITARYMKAMDYVISVDTGTVHLAGALNIPCLMTQPEDKYICWRWHFDNWYSSVKTFKQPSLEGIINYLKEDKNGKQLHMEN